MTSTARQAGLMQVWVVGKTRTCTMRAPAVSRRHEHAWAQHGRSCVVLRIVCVDVLAKSIDAVLRCC